MQKLAITGATGLLGSNLVRQAAKTYDVVAMARCVPDFSLDARGCWCDLTNPDIVLRFLDEIRPEIIVHCAAITDVDRCEVEPESAWRLHVEATQALARWAEQSSAYMVLISTDSVFDGRVGHYSEKDLPSPVNEYARTKLAAEEAVGELNPSALILRTNFYGWNAKAKTSLGEWILKSLVCREPLSAFHDVRFSPLLVNDLANVVLDLISRRPAGIYHAAAGDDCSKYQFALLLANVFGLDAGTIVPISVEDFRFFKARRPKDTSLRVEKVSKALGRVMPSVEDGLRSFKTLLDSDYVRILKGWQPDWLDAARVR